MRPAYDVLRARTSVHSVNVFGNVHEKSMVSVRSPAGAEKPLDEPAPDCSSRATFADAVAGRPLPETSAHAPGEKLAGV